MIRVVDSSLQFHDQIQFGAVEVSDVSSDMVLSAEFQPFKSAISQSLPKQ